MPDKTALRRVAIVNYNTPELTQAAIRSLNRHTPGCVVTVFDNSDKRPFVEEMGNVAVIDNTKGQVIDFERWLDGFSHKARTVNGWASARHCYTIQWMIDNSSDPFVLMDSDVLIRKDISSFWDATKAFVGQIMPHSSIYGITVDRVLPFLCYLDVRMIRKYNIRYFSPDKMYALSSKRPGVAYDTGCFFLEECKRSGAPFTDRSIEPFALHFGHGSWKEKDYKSWLEENRELYD